MFLLGLNIPQSLSLCIMASCKSLLIIIDILSLGQ